jgi:NAD(P)-dependent dehydrogenase (short-subunit alcohol dehydrogenase family)
MTATQPVALVTGASSGIGKAASLALAQAGFEVIGTSRHTLAGHPARRCDVPRPRRDQRRVGHYRG